MIKVYGVNEGLLKIEENGVDLEDIYCSGSDVRLFFDDGTVLFAQYSIEEIDIWSFTIEEEGYAENYLTLYEDLEDPTGDIFEIDADLEHYEAVSQ